MTKIYEVEICRTSWVTLTIEADSEEEAEAKAWEEIGDSAEYGSSGDAHWDCERIEEVGVKP
jgi:hypothetical protein